VQAGPGSFIRQASLLELRVPLLLAFVFLISSYGTLWILPIVIGMVAVRSRNLPPLFGLLPAIPVVGWAACVILFTLPKHTNCEVCGEHIHESARKCKYCHSWFDA
jgi:hypothetical protein